MEAGLESIFESERGRKAVTGGIFQSSCRGNN
jgi:hypothetical protein